MRQQAVRVGGAQSPQLPAADGSGLAERRTGPERPERSVGRLSLPWSPRNKGASARSASFTDAALGNTSRTSASTTTTLVPSTYLAAVAPRTAPLKSYSGREATLCQPRPVAESGSAVDCLRALWPCPTVDLATLT